MLGLERAVTEADVALAVITALRDPALFGRWLELFTKAKAEELGSTQTELATALLVYLDATLQVGELELGFFYVDRTPRPFTRVEVWGASELGAPPLPAWAAGLTLNATEYPPAELPGAFGRFLADWGSQ